MGRMKLVCMSVVCIATGSGAFNVRPQPRSAWSVPPPSAASSLTYGLSPHAAGRQGRPFFMSSSSADAGVAFDNKEPTMPTSGGGDLTPPPGVAEQAEAEMVTPSTSTVFVAGGSGFVGSEICKQLVDAGCNVIALSRKGAPAHGEGSWTKSVKWVKGNALNQELYRSELRKSDTVVSCVGGIGKTDAYMGLVNGEANIKLAEAAADAGVKQFVFMSVHDYKAPSFVKRVGYFDGKRRTEKTVGELFGAKGAILKPALIYGERQVNVRGRTVKVPLQAVGGPLARITSTGIGKKIAESGLPLADVAWTQPLSAESVAKSVVRCCLEGTDNLGGKGKDSGDAVVLRVQDMAQLVA